MSSSKNLNCLLDNYSSLQIHLIKYSIHTPKLSAVGSHSNLAIPLIERLVTFLSIIYLLYKIRSCTPQVFCSKNSFCFIHSFALGFLPIYIQIYIQKTVNVCLILILPIESSFFFFLFPSRIFLLRSFDGNGDDFNGGFKLCYDLLLCIRWRNRRRKSNSSKICEDFYNTYKAAML